MAQTEDRKQLDRIAALAAKGMQQAREIRRQDLDRIEAGDRTLREVTSRLRKVISHLDDQNVGLAREEVASLIYGISDRNGLPITVERKLQEITEARG